MTEAITRYTSDAIKDFFHRSFELSGLQAEIEESEQNGVRAVVNLRINDDESLQVTMQFQGTSLRFIAHKVVAGQLNEQARENHWLVNQTPWYGRVYQSPDNDGTDLSLGIPAPLEANGYINLEPYLGILLNSAVQLRAGQVPIYAGLSFSDKAAILHRVKAWLHGLNIACVFAQSDQVLVFDTYTSAQREARVELFIVDQVLVARAHAQSPPKGLSKDYCLDRTETVNKFASAGALSYDDELNNFVGLVSLLPAIQKFSENELFWMIQRALELVEAGFTEFSIG